MHAALKYLIYGLVDPRDGQLRYVSKSSSGLTRPKQHWSSTELRKNSTWHSTRWVQSVIDAGSVPEIVILQSIGNDSTILADAEKFWIKYFRSLGVPLTNGTDGGEGCPGRLVLDYVKNKIRLSNMESKRSITKEQEKEMCSRYLAGENSYQLSKAFGIERHTVTRWLKKNGIKIRAKSAGEVRRRLPIQIVPNVIDEYIQGTPVRKLAQKYGTYTSNIYLMLNRFNIQRRGVINGR